MSCKLEVLPNGESRGFGYVQYVKKEEAERAIAETNGKTFFDKVLEVQKHQKKDARTPTENKIESRTIQVANAMQMPLDQFRHILSQYGEIEIIDVYGELRMATYKNVEGANKAFADLITKYNA